MSETSPAQELREAARLMRERAEAASVLSPPPWRVIPAAGDPPVPWVASTSPAESARGGFIAPGYLVDCRHIAGMHPGVALAVADLLDKIAWMVELDPDLDGRVGVDETLAVARTFMGTKEASDGS